MLIPGREKLAIQETFSFLRLDHNPKSISFPETFPATGVVKSEWKQRAKEGKTPISFVRPWQPHFCFKLTQFKPNQLLLHRAGS